jgi:flagellar motor protein MotB
LRGNHKDRWLLPYADFITLLFATFVLMYATAKAKEGSNPLIHPAKPPARELKTAVQSNLLTDLQKSLQLEQQSALLTVSVDQRGIIITLDDRDCFRPGQVQVEPSAVPMFEKVAGILARYDNRITAVWRSLFLTILPQRRPRLRLRIPWRSRPKPGNLRNEANLLRP